MNVICRNCKKFGVQCVGMEDFYTGCIFFDREHEGFHQTCKSLEKAIQCKNLLKKVGRKALVQEFYDENGIFWDVVEY